MAAGDVEAINTLGPKNDGPFPIARAAELLGGFRSVADAAARDAIPTQRRQAGMWVVTNDDGRVWKLGAGLTNGDWSEVVFSGGGPPQAFRVVADLAAREAIPAGERQLLMIVVQLDTFEWWSLVSGLTNADWEPCYIAGLRFNYNGSNTEITGPVLLDGQFDVAGYFTAQSSADLASIGGTVRLGNNTVGGQVLFRTQQSGTDPYFPLDDATSGSVRLLPGGPHASVSAAILSALNNGGKPRGQRFLTGSSPQIIHVDPSAGNDTTGDGLTTGTSYATIQRAINDIPDGFRTDIIVQLTAGSFAGQNFHVNVTPGYRTGGTQANIYVTGSQTAAFTYASSGSGTLVSGKSSQIRYTLAHGLTITDGSHWITNNSGAAPATTRVLRASSTSEIIVVQSSTVARSTEKICTFATIFTSSFSCGSIMGPNDAPFVHLVGIRFDAAGIFTNVVINGSRVAGGTHQNVNVFAAVFTASPTFVDYRNRNASMFNALFLGTAVVTGPRGSMQQCVFNVTGNPCLSLGSPTFGNPLPVHPGSGVRLATALDFEGTGVGIEASGNSYFITNGAITFSLTNRALDGTHGALFSASSASTWSGTVTIRSRLRSRAWFSKDAITYSVTNTSSPGSDFEVGASGTVVAASGSVMDLVDLASFQ